MTEVIRHSVLLQVLCLSCLVGCALLVPSPPHLGGYVLSVQGNEVLIDLTKQQGITTGMEFLML